VLALDTNTLVYYFKAMGRVVERLQATLPGEVAIPAVVLYVPEVGIAQSTQPARRRRALAPILESVQLLPFDGPVARVAASTRVALERGGTPIAPLDILIAGAAHAHSAILVTHNTAEYARAPGLRICDWW
jgi:tRNA(fMet)-specific endonuclease VapC